MICRKYTPVIQWGLCIKISEILKYYFDSDGNKVTDGNGVHKVVNEYDSDGNLLAKELFALPDQGGIWGNSNVHCVKRTWANGNVTSEEYYAPDGTQAADNNGVTEKKFHYKKMDYGLINIFMQTAELKY